MKFSFLLFCCLTLAGKTVLAQHVNWAQTLPLPAHSEVTAMATDQAGFLYVTGRHGQHQIRKYGSLFAVGHVFLNKYDSLGTLLWSHNFSGEGRAFDLTVDADNNLVMCGSYLTSLAFETDTIVNLPAAHPRFGSFLAKFTDSGNLIWVNATALADYDLANVSVATDSQRNIFIAGIDEQLDGLFAKYDAAGILDWKKQVPGVRTYSDVAVTSSDEIFVSGTCSPLTSFDGITPSYTPQVGYFNFLLKCSNQGVTQEAVAKPFITFHFSSAVTANGTDALWHYEDSPVVHELESKVSVYAGGAETNLLQHTESATGFYPNTLATGHTGKTVFLRNFGPYLLSQAELSLYAYRNGSLSTTPEFQAFGMGLEGTALAVHDETTYVGGHFFQQTLNFGNHTLQNPHSQSAWETQPFIARISNTFLAAQPSVAKQTLKLYPNPAANQFTVLAPEGTQPSGLRILDQTGRTVHSQLWPERTARCVVKTALPAGIYVVQMEGAAILFTQKLVIN